MQVMLSAVPNPWTSRNLQSGRQKKRLDQRLRLYDGGKLRGRRGAGPVCAVAAGGMRSGRAGYNLTR